MSAKDYRVHVGEPDKRWGKPLPNSRGSINQLPGDVDHEDACIWEVNGQYHAIMTDMSGWSNANFVHALSPSCLFRL